VTSGRSSRFHSWSAFAFGQDGVFAELTSAVEKGLSKTGLMLFMQLDQGAVARKEVRDDKKNRDRAVQFDHFQAV
jgi:hypothetical protein